VSVDFTGDDGRDVWILSPGGGSFWRATFDRDGQDASWHPGGNSIIYTSWRNGSLGIWMKSIEGETSADSILTDPFLAETGELVNDSTIVTAALERSSGSSLDVVSIGRSKRGAVEAVVADSSSTRFPAVSPDGHWLAYVSDRSGADEVYLRPWRREGDYVRVSAGGGTEPVWSPHGDRLFYRGQSGRRATLIAASLLAGAASPTISRRPLFPLTGMVRGAVRANYDVSPDGMIFVMIRRNLER
jgi:Tol biopolymer transport system component